MDTVITKRLSDLRDDLVRVRALRDVKQKRAETLKKESEEFTKKSLIYSKCLELFKSWLEDSVTKNVVSISDLATSALNHVIDDQSMSLSVVQEHKNNKVHMGFVLNQDGNSGDPLNSFGGGAAVLISLILRVSVMQRMKMCNVLILDESMVALANAYVPNAASFMKELSDKTGVNILMVTHNPEFIQNSHLSYEGTKTDSLKLKIINRDGR